ncbi:anthranilate synthase component I family protein [Maridesulfovibrio sp. FT414]|uniref:anthranilate synthase component I family protein n=1 Tax=Maridesulfovibrio sp. FT414 TaxID=2979469 RepID=UPI003D8031F8
MLSSFTDPVSFKSFREAAFYFVNECGADVLLGAADYHCSAVSYLCLGPVDELLLEAGSTADEIRAEIKKFAFADKSPAIGFVSYECGHVLRGISSSRKIDYPLVHLKKYDAVFTHDATSGEVRLLYGDDACLHSFIRILAENRPIPETDLPVFGKDSIEMSLGKEAYTDGVAKTLEHIRDGLTYQLNLTTRFTLPSENVDPVRWFFALNDKYPAPYYALFRSGGKTVISTSPELFLRVEGGIVTSEPIKGTLRFDDFSEDLKHKLTDSVKEDSELSMIVDLVRNDISANCRYGSVVVEDHKSVFAVDNLLQMFSRVRGELAEGSDCIDLFFDAFPGGSITGCPKKSSMELIDNLESHTRGPYCGSMIVVHGPQDMVSSIAIRTAVHDGDGGNIFYWAGSGIVIDSNPEAEYLETLAKAGKILNPELL